MSLIGRHVRVFQGPHTGATGTVDFVDSVRGRVLVNVSGRFGGLTWIAYDSLFDSTTNRPLEVEPSDVDEVARCVRIEIGLYEGAQPGRAYREGKIAMGLGILRLLGANELANKLTEEAQKKHARTE